MASLLTSPSTAGWGIPCRLLRCTCAIRRNKKEGRDADRRFTNTPLGKCQDVAATPADPYLLDGRRPAGDGAGWGRRGGDPSAQHAGRGSQRAGGQRGAPTPGQILHPGEFRPAESGSAQHRQKLAATAGHARLPLHLQPAAPAELVDRWLARLVLGGVRARKAASRHAARWTYGRPRQDRRSSSRAEAAYRTPWPRRWWQRRDR